MESVERQTILDLVIVLANQYPLVDNKNPLGASIPDFIPRAPVHEDSVLSTLWEDTGELSEVLLDLEEKFGIAFTGEEECSLYSIGTLVDLTLEKLNKKDVPNGTLLA